MFLRTCVCVADVALGKLYRLDRGLLSRGTVFFGGDGAGSCTGATVFFTTFDFRNLLLGNRRSWRDTFLIHVLLCTFKRPLWPLHLMLLFFRWGIFQGACTSWFWAGRVLRACGLICVRPLDEFLWEAHFLFRTLRGRRICHVIWGGVLCDCSGGSTHFLRCSQWIWALWRFHFQVHIFLILYVSVREGVKFLQEFL